MFWFLEAEAVAADKKFHSHALNTTPKRHHRNLAIWLSRNPTGSDPGGRSRFQKKNRLHLGMHSTLLLCQAQDVRMGNPASCRSSCTASNVRSQHNHSACQVELGATVSCHLTESRPSWVGDTAGRHRGPRLADGSLTRAPRGHYLLDGTVPEALVDTSSTVQNGCASPFPSSLPPPGIAFTRISHIAPHWQQPKCPLPRRVLYKAFDFPPAPLFPFFVLAAPAQSEWRAAPQREVPNIQAH